MSIAEDILNAKVLIVDDMEINVKLLEYMMQSAGYTNVSSTLDSREVLALYEEHRYDLILLDLSMPHMSGFDVMEVLKPIETGGYIPVLVITAEPSHKLRALQAGAKDFVAKPFDQIEVLTRIHNMLEIRLLHNRLRLYNDSLELTVEERTSDLRAAEAKVGYLLNFDNVTGLPNRILLRDRVARAQGRVMTSGNALLGLMLVNLSRLAAIRDGLGIKTEQNMLIVIAHRLLEWAQREDTVARYGDESFALVTVRSDLKEFAGLAAEVLAVLDEPFIVEGQELHVEACIGIAIFPNDGDDFDVLIQAAEASAHRALAGKTERYQFYTPELNRSANERLKFENALRRAIERNELLLHYQPQVDLQSGKIIGLEALVRWQHPELGLVPPARFIGLAEESGLILSIGEWVLREACRQNREWQNAGLPKVPVAVNLSAKQFVECIATKVGAILDETGLEATYLELELTESISMEDPENTIGILRTLKDMGLCLSIDDFGTGYSNLNYLRRFPLDKLKLDQSFVHELISDPDDLSISRAVIAMAHTLRLKVIAEGVETEGQRRVLTMNGCDEMQGYLFSRPLPAAECAQYLRDNRMLAVNSYVQDPQHTMLLLSNQENWCAWLQKAITSLEYQLLISNSVAEVFEMLATHDVGVVVYDPETPQAGGMAFVHRLKQMHPTLVYLAINQSSHAEGAALLEERSIFNYLSAADDQAEVKQKIEEAFLEFASRLA